MDNYYQALSLQPSARPEEIKEAYQKQRLSLLTSNAEDTPELLAAQTALDEAYAILSDPSQRAAYDRSLGLDQSPAALVVARDSGSIIRPEAPPVPVVQKACPSCGALNPVQASMCLTCGAQVNRPCPKCGSPVGIMVTVCPRCETFIPEYDRSRLAQSMVASDRIQQERQVTEASVSRLEEGYRRSTVFGVLFYVALAVIFLGLCPLAVFVFMLVLGM